MEYYELFFRGTFLGTLTVDTAANRHAFAPDAAGVAAAAEETVLTVEVARGTDGFVPPIPFFQSRLRNMQRLGSTEFRSHTDYFLLRRRPH